MFCCWPNWKCFCFVLYFIHLMKWKQIMNNKKIINASVWSMWSSMKLKCCRSIFHFLWFIRLIFHSFTKNIRKCSQHLIKFHGIICLLLYIRKIYRKIHENRWKLHGNSVEISWIIQPSQIEKFIEIGENFRKILSKIHGNRWNIGLFHNFLLILKIPANGTLVRH